MPGIQYLGNIESDKNADIPYLANALKGGMEGFNTGRKIRQEREDVEFSQKIQLSALDIKQKELENSYAKLDYDKRKDMYDTMVKLMPTVPPEKQKELTSSPEWIKLEESLGMPNLSGTTMTPDVKPSWGQAQENASIKADLTRGRGSISTLLGEPLEFIIDSKDKALDYISKKGRNPAEFANELASFDETTSVSEGTGKDKYKVGQTIKKDGKTYKYIGNGKWSY
jgi:hypothetical protein